jgi:hypothetical protein
MWFGLTDESKSQQTIAELAKPEHQTDWGMRIISNRAAKYSGGGYHYGSVWPLFTGWASVAEYRYHRPQAAYDNLRANALLALDGSPGHVTEVLSGDYYQPLSTSSPHQIWSAAMVVSPMLRGMFGLSFNAQSHALVFAPHIPADWKTFSIENVAAGADTINIRLERTANEISVKTERKGDAPVRIEFSPAISMRAQVLGATLNGKPISFHVEPHGTDQHVTISADLSSAENTIRIRTRADFFVTYNAKLPSLGSTGEGLRILSETWTNSKDAVTLETEGSSGHTYVLNLYGKQQIKSVDGARLTDGETIEESFPVVSGEGASQKQAVTIHFASLAQKSNR